jgi:hypothetical protein
MVKRSSEILEEWIALMVESGHISCKEDIPPEDYDRLVDASQRFERIMLLREIGDMKVKD